MLDVLRDWWLSEASGPGLLVTVRIISTVFSITSALAWVRLARARVSEASWQEWDVRTFRLAAWGVALGSLFVALYFLTAGVLESERTSSPHRLLVANFANACVFVPLTLFAVFLKARYTSKRVWKVTRGRA